MFNNLMDFGYKRSTKEAFGFYVAYIIILILLASVLGSIIALIIAREESAALAIGVKIGQVFAIVGSLATSYLVLKGKNLLGEFNYILLGLCSGLLAVFLGGLGGMIPAAYFTTLPKKEEAESPKKISEPIPQEQALQQPTPIPASAPQQPMEAEKTLDVPVDGTPAI